MFVSVVATTGLFELLLRFLPDVHLHWRDVMTGALATAVFFTIGRQLIGLYLGQSRMASGYSAAILLLRVYYSCQDPAARRVVHPGTRSARRRDAVPESFAKQTLARAVRHQRRHAGTPGEGC
jgi:hypothetical protein